MTKANDSAAPRAFRNVTGTLYLQNAFVGIIEQQGADELCLPLIFDVVSKLLRRVSDYFSAIRSSDFMGDSSDGMWIAIWFSI